MLEEEKSEIEIISKKIKNNLQALKLEQLKENLNNLKKQQTNPEFYKNYEKLKTINIKIKEIEKIIHPWIEIENKKEDLQALVEMAIEEEDFSLNKEIKTTIKKIRQTLDKLEIIRIFKDKDDFSNTYLSIHSGAGGTESCDWSLMLYRMYLRWIESMEFKHSIVDYQSGEEAGIKSVTIYVKGNYAHGYLKAETGVHRLVRISPFDSAKKRHTSFSSVLLTPEINEDINIDIQASDIRVDTYRAGGAGGQHVNKTDSAVRITHLKTNIVTSCQAERSQFQNKERAMKILKARVYDYYKQQEKEKIKNKSAEKKKIEWGSQIRSYIFHPYNLVKDHRTGYEIGNIQAVMNGEISGLINAWLRI